MILSGYVAAAMKGHARAHAVAGGRDAAGLHVGLDGHVLEERDRVGHRLRRRDGREESLAKDLELRGIAEDGLRVHRLVWAGAIEEIGHEREVAALREALADREHRGADADAVHEHEDAGPRAFAVGSKYVGGTDSVFCRDLDLRAHLLPRKR